MRTIDHESKTEPLTKQISDFNNDLELHQQAEKAVHVAPEFSVEEAIEFAPDTLLKNRQNRVNERFRCQQSTVLLQRRYVELLEVIQPELEKTATTAAKAVPKAEAKATQKLATVGISAETMPAANVNPRAAEIQFSHHLSRVKEVIEAREDAASKASALQNNATKERSAKTELSRVSSDLTEFLKQAIAV